MPQPFPYVLNVISEDADALAGPLRAATAQFGAAGEIAWLAPQAAFDIPFLDRPLNVLAAARATVEGIPAAINCECLDELADMAGLKEKVAPITEAAMRGEMEFEPALRARAALLQGLPVSALERVYRERVRLNPGATELVATMRAQGARTMLVSSGFTYFTRAVAHACGFDSEQANELLHENGNFTGRVAEPILGRDAKLRALEKTVAEMHIDFADVIAVGDGANDLAMVQRAGLGVAWHAKPILAEAADAVIAHSDLKSLLYLQGYSASELVR
jgi:phosphoserine phosphatase